MYAHEAHSTDTRQQQCLLCCTGCAQAVLTLTCQAVHGGWGGGCVVHLNGDVLGHEPEEGSGGGVGSGCLDA